MIPTIANITAAATTPGPQGILSTILTAMAVSFVIILLIAEVLVEAHGALQAKPLMQRMITIGSLLIVFGLIVAWCLAQLAHWI